MERSASSRTCIMGVTERKPSRNLSFNDENPLSARLVLGIVFESSIGLVGQGHTP